MPVPAGVRDGAFIKFEGWDIPGSDVAHYQKYDGNIQKLKDVVTENPVSVFYAFNSRGWIKSLPFIDASYFKKDSGYDTYVRVEFAGWLFYAGEDHGGDDLYRIDEYNTFPSLTTEIDARTAQNPKGLEVAAFNTRGYVKSKVHYPLSNFNDATSLDGIYIRTDFPGFHFFPQCDTWGNDIIDATDKANDIPSLITRCEDGEAKGAYAFNTTGWIKNKVTIPPSKSDYFKNDFEGIYVRTEWPDFVYLPGIVSPGNDITQITGKNVAELIAEARKDARVVAFNTNGWMKSAVASEPESASQPRNVLFGTYVKVPVLSQELEADENLLNENALTISLFILKASVTVWAFWLIPDGPVRAEYAKAVAKSCNEILEYVSKKEFTLEQAVQMAFDMRQQYLVWAREKSSGLGQFFASAMKPADLKIDRYLNSKSQKLFQKTYGLLTATQQSQVMTEVIKSSGRANPTVSKALKGAGILCKAAVPIAVALSLVSIAIAPDWEAELAQQISSWSRAIVYQTVVVEAVALWSPAGAILGGIAGTIVATIVDNNEFPDLIDWFYGGASRSSAAHILGDAYEPAREAAMKMIEGSGRKYHVHRVYTNDLLAINETPTRATEVAEKMVSESGDIEQRESDKVAATIVWTGSASTDISATNPGNPGDLINLIQWVQTNLPSYVSGVKVSYNDSPPSDSISEINKGIADINHNYGGKYVWLTPQWTDDRDKAATYFEVLITGSSQSGLDDLAKGAGGDYRYLIPKAEVHVDKKIRRLALYRKSNGEGPVKSGDIAGRGYTDFSTDINAGRGGDYLHLIWDTGF